MKKILIISFLIGALMFAGWLVCTEHIYVVPILAYHHIDKEIHKDSPTVLAENFQMQMKYIYDRGYNVITVDELINSINKDIKLPRNSVVITIDDGYDDNYIYAYPFFKKYNFPATIFIITKWLEKEGYLSWDQILEMSQNNIAFGAHTRTHAYLPEIKDSQLYDEILGSKLDIQARLKKEAKYFCYPIGGFSDKIIQHVRAAGYGGAFTTNRGEGRFNKNIFALKRIKMTNSDTNVFRMWGKLSGFYNLFREEKSPY
ncbi:MAG: polysaccharide deacetylase family protein [Candidatus Omnitrophota bacterium]